MRTLENKDQHAFQEMIKELQRYDQAQMYKQLPKQYKDTFLQLLTVPQLTGILTILRKSEQLDVLEIIETEQASKVLSQMDNDNLVSLLTDLEPKRTEKLLSGMKQDKSDTIQNLMKYPEETAGRIMNNQFVWIDQDYTVRGAVDKLKHFAELAEYLNYLYVIDDDRKLMGVVSYRDLLLADMHEKIADMMQTRVVKVNAYIDQEEVAKLIKRYDFVTMPVVEEDNTLAGVVTFDDIIDVVYLEADEDIGKLSASGKALDFDTKATTAAYRRLPWLILLLFIGIVSGSIIAGFEETLEQVVALAFFMPMIAGMTGNTGTQSLAVVVRGLTTNDLGFRQIIKLLLRELWVGIIIGVTCGIIIAIIAFFWQGSAMLGFVVGISLLCTLIIGTLAGTIIPLALYRLNVDPAVASGPLITTINDILSLLIYFGIATFFISSLM
jgi:magnesium transporter